MDIKKIYNQDNIKYIFNNLEYEFIINNNEALINYTSLNHLEEIINEFHLLHPNIVYYYTYDYSFEMRFDETFTFKLPISIIQPTKLFLNEDYLHNINNPNYDSIIFPVNIINDEYVILNGHHLLYQAANDNIRMVNVYIKDYETAINNILYIAKEQNIKHIKNLEVLNNTDYNNIITQLEILKGL